MFTSAFAPRSRKTGSWGKLTRTALSLAPDFFASSRPPKEKLPAWKQKSLAFRQAVLAGKAAGGDAAAAKEAAKISEELAAAGGADAGMTKCPHCGRTFNKDAGERHIAICAKTFGSKPGGGRLVRGGGGKARGGGGAPAPTRRARRARTTAAWAALRGGCGSDAPCRSRSSGAPGGGVPVPEGFAGRRVPPGRAGGARRARAAPRGAPSERRPSGGWLSGRASARGASATRWARGPMGDDDEIFEDADNVALLYAYGGFGLLLVLYFVCERGPCHWSRGLEATYLAVLLLSVWGTALVWCEIGISESDLFRSNARLRNLMRLFLVAHIFHKFIAVQSTPKFFDGPSAREDWQDWSRSWTTRSRRSWSGPRAGAT
ncbi:unnamed protein product [Prorocentrum cordatum]|uniref:C2HC/C3H-type domain-containing protein n=1 Tax=Prorocentrum cordatum TaxID=2364126 RepID=A0ABN9WHM0_9DINO|nr:unnamed protein product [Polarella glacialis]